jgi:outer membrane receptor protein involved in Fe transport
MNDVPIARRAAQAAVALLFFSASFAAAQDDPLEDIGDEAPQEEAPTEDAPAEEAPPSDIPPAEEEPAPAEDVIDPDAGVPAEEEVLDPDGGVPVEPAPEEPAGEDMVVTGSRIRRSNFAQPAAVQVMDRKQLTESGATNMTDVAKNMTINAGSNLNTDVSTGTAGAAQFNLRGLGVSSTLVLLNGRRLPLLATTLEDGSSFVDINSVPLGIIERIEVLKGGASAIYGSDAVAGVVNILTRKRLDGFEAHAGYQTTDDMDHDEWDVSLLGGAQGERTRVLGAVGYFRRSPLAAADRDFTQNNRNVSQLGWPSAFLQYTPTGGVRQIEVPNPDPATVMEKPTVLAPVSYRDPGCGTVPRSAPAAGALQFCGFNFNDYFMLMIDEERANVYSSLEHDIGDHTMAFFEATYARSRSSRTQSPSYPLLLPVFVPADHPYNPTGDRLRWYGRVAGGLSPPYVTTYDSDTLHTAAGVGGDFGFASDDLSEWTWELAGTWSGNRYQVFTQDVLTDNLQDALNSCGEDDDPADCWNPFSFGPANSQTLVDRITGELRGKTDATLTTAGLDFTGPLFELPGGDMSIAFGGQMRFETAQSNPDHDSNQEAYVFLVGGPDWQADRQIAAAYAEMLFPFVRGFELQTAGRFEKYSDAGSSADPMLGISWTPATTFAGPEAAQAAKVRLRGTFSTAFRAPSLLQMHGAFTELSEIRSTAPNPVFTAIRSFGNEDLTPQKSTTFTAGFDWAPVNGLYFEGDYWNYNYRELISKESAQRKVTEDLMTMADPDIVWDDASGLPTRINVRFINADEVSTHGIDLSAMYRSNFGAEAGTFSFGAGGSYVLGYYIPQSTVPTALQDEEFLSCDAAPVMGAAPPSSANCDVAGSRNIATFPKPLPRLRASFPVGWGLSGHNVSLNTNFVSGYRDDADTNPSPTAERYRGIAPMVTLDLQYSYKIDWDEHIATTFRVGVTNLLDTPPPTLTAGLGYDVYTHDPRGRLLYVRLVQEL